MVANMLIIVDKYNLLDFSSATMSTAITRTKCPHAHPSQEQGSAAQSRPAAREEISARAHCPPRGRERPPGKERRGPVLVQIAEAIRLAKKGKTSPRGGRYLDAPVEGSDDSDSFRAEDNENELRSGIVDRGRSPERPVGQPRRGKSPPAREHFDLEMNRHGLLDKIANIQRLNNYFESEIGGKLNDISASGQCSEDSATFEKSFKGQAPTKGFTFPFQKRARSHSPPRNGQLFSPASPVDETSAKTGRKPVVANFVLGRNLRVSAAKVPGEQIRLARVLEREDTTGLSTGSTREEKKQTKGLEEEWMYQRLEGEGKCDAGPLRDLRDTNLLQLINRMASDEGGDS